MEKRAISWEKLMVFLQEILELLIQVQQGFLFLGPIFSYEDIKDILKDEFAKFSEVRKSNGFPNIFYSSLTNGR